MITDQDVEKLKKTFVIKDEFNKVADSITSEFIGLVEMIGEMNKQLVERLDRIEKALDDTNTLLVSTIKRLDERFTEYDELHRDQDEKFYRLLEKMNEQQTLVFGHEKRFQRIETKLFPTP